MKELFAAYPLLWGILAGYVLIVNLVGFFLMLRDKRLARQTNARRIPEKTLFLAALLGGSIGTVAGMQVFRHKTKHWYFVFGMPAILILQIVLVVWAFVS